MHPTPGWFSERIGQLLSGAILRQFLVYTLVGAVATVVDWSVFYLMHDVASQHYRLSVTVSFILGSATNYTMNRWLTFQDKNRAYALQISVFTAVSLLSLLISIGIMTFMVELVLLQPMLARVLTTGTMLVANFTMHRSVTFNNVIYRRIREDQRKA